MKYSLPIMGCLCLPCRGESCCVRGRGWGTNSGVAALCEPPLRLSVPPTMEGLVEAAIEKQA